MDVDIDSVIVCVSIFSRSFSVRMYYRTALNAIFDWICALEVFFIIIIIYACERKKNHYLYISMLEEDFKNKTNKKS